MNTDRTIKFHCSEGSVCLFDEDADEMIWSMSLEYSDEVEEKLYELLALMVGGERIPPSITFPGIGKMISKEQE